MEKETIHKLNDLIQTCKDGQQGFRQAAHEVTNEQFRALFLSTAFCRGHFASELQQVVRTMGAKPATRGSLIGLLHRGWMNLRSHMDHEDRVILAECRRGEETALKKYEDVIEYKQLPRMEPMLEKQFLNMIEMRNLLGNAVTDKEEKDPNSLLHL